MAEATARLRRWSAFVARLALLITLGFAISARIAMTQSILRDAETEALFHDIARPILQAGGVRPENVQIVLLQDKSTNAFVVVGHIVGIHSYLIAAADNANEVQ